MMFSDESDASFKTRSDDSFRWVDESDLSDAYVDVVENFPLSAALSSETQQPSPVAPGIIAEQPATADTPVASSSPSLSVAETPVLFEPSESMPNANLHLLMLTLHLVNRNMS